MLSKHGEFVAPEVLALGEKERGEPNPEAVAGVLQRFSKSKRASDTPTAMASVTAVYPDAIQLMEAAGSTQMRGMGLMVSVAMTAVAVWLLSLMYEDVTRELSSDWPSYYFLLGIAFILMFMIFFVRRWIVLAWKLDMFAADEQPTIFDRKHRKVYRLFTPLDGSADTWAQRFKPIELQAVEYEWDCITAEHRAEMVTSGKTVSRIHRLVMVARDHRKPGQKQGRLLEEFNVGNSMALGENSVPMLWEHIRRFMEERGPGVPEGESMQVFERPKNLWQSMGVVSPFGPRFGWWWRTNRFVTVFFLVIAPFSVPYFTLWAICNWISHMTMRKTVWPQVVHERLGKAIRSSG